MRLGILDRLRQGCALASHGHFFSCVGLVNCSWDGIYAAITLD
jgi:hypothetical protein